MSDAPLMSYERNPRQTLARRSLARQPSIPFSPSRCRRRGSTWCTTKRRGESSPGCSPVSLCNARKSSSPWSVRSCVSISLLFSLRRKKKYRVYGLFRLPSCDASIVTRIKFPERNSLPLRTTQTLPKGRHVIPPRAHGVSQGGLRATTLSCNARCHRNSEPSGTHHRGSILFFHSSESPER